MWNAKVNNSININQIRAGKTSIINVIFKKMNP